MEWQTANNKIKSREKSYYEIRSKLVLPIDHISIECDWNVAMISISIFHIELIEALVEISIINKTDQFAVFNGKFNDLHDFEVVLSKRPMNDVSEMWNYTFTTIIISIKNKILLIEPKPKYKCLGN